MKFYIWIVLLLLVNNLYSKEISSNQIKVAYTYNFLKNIIWQDETKIDKYRLLVVSKDKNIKNLFLMLASRKSLKGKNIEVLFYDAKKNQDNIQVIYVDNESKKAYEKLFNLYEDKGILFISDEYENKKQVMINLLQNENKITFEINKANILNRDLQVSPNMVLLGGTEIDVAKLYKTSQDELKEHKKTISELNKNIHKKNKELNEKINAIKEKNLIVEKQKKSIKEQQAKLNKQNQELKAIYTNIESQKAKLSSETEKVKEKESIVESLVNLQNEKNNELDKTQKELEALNKRIEQQKVVLVKKDGLISMQQNTIELLAFLTGIIILLGLYGIKQNRLLKNLSQTDSLSGLYNRRFMNKKIEEEIIKYKRYQTPFSILLIDIDYFKQINDNFGHDKGDIVIKTIANIMKNHTRDTDICARWGGEEFLILVQNTDLNGAFKLAENLRQKIEKCQFTNIKKQITISTGVSTFTPEQSLESIIKITDDKLYKAKENGRNRVEIE